MDDFVLELKKDFLDEAADLISGAEVAFLRLEAERTNQDLINQIFRLAHNLKGASKAVGFEQLAELTHIAESLILLIKENKVEVNNCIISLLLEFKDKINDMVEGLKVNLDQNFDIIDISAKIQKIISNPCESNNESLTKEQSVFCEAEKEVINFSQKEPERSDFRDEFVVVENIKEEVSVSTTEGASREKTTNSSTGADPNESIRVSLSKIDDINNLIGELVILQTVISQRRVQFCQDEIMNKSIGSMNKLFKEAQELVMSLRMLPLKNTFQKMNRIVRDTSRQLDKDVCLVISGEETDVDKTVLEKLADPLVHIIRNAVDHGLETPKDRIAAGKPPQGQVTLKAYHQGSQLIVEVADDGKGIDPEVVYKKAIQKKIVKAGTDLNDSEKLNFIFHPGFSTKEEVTEVSGRGVGMDVVKTNIESVGGEVKFSSEVGKGSSFKIIIPLTLAIIEGVVISAGHEKYVVPLSQISEIVQVSPHQVKSFSGVASLFELRGEVLPIFSINEKLGLRKDSVICKTALIVRGLNHNFAVTIEDILNQQQIVIKNLGKDIQGRKGIMGSAIMSDGRPSLILDLFELYRNDFKKSEGFQKIKTS